MKSFLLLFVFSLTLHPLFGEETKKDEPSSVIQDRRDVLRFGIESEIIELAKKLGEDEDESLAEEVGLMLDKPLSGKIAASLFAYLEKIKSPLGEAAALRYIDNFEEEKTDLILSALRYLSQDEIPAHPEKVEVILKSNMKALFSACVSYLGKKSGPTSSELLLETFHDEASSLQLRGDIILALGNMKSKNSVSFLTGLLDDEDEDSTLRRYACDSLGKIADPEGLPAVKKALESADPILRSYAVYALGSFPGSETETILLSALRDTYPRVRELAANRLGNLQIEGAVEILIYRAKKDGEKKVRIAAFEALADIGDEKALAFLTEYLENERSPQEFRTLIASELIEKRLSSSLSSIEKVMAQEWTKDNSRLLDSLCKILSRTKAEGLEKVFEKMLEHRSFIIQIYAMRGIGKNSLSALKEKVEELTKENHHPLVRKNALSALENL